MKKTICEASQIIRTLCVNWKFKYCTYCMMNKINWVNLQLIIKNENYIIKLVKWSNWLSKKL